MPQVLLLFFSMPQGVFKGEHQLSGPMRQGRTPGAKFVSGQRAAGGHWPQISQVELCDEQLEQMVERVLAWKPHATVH